MRADREDGDPVGPERLDEPSVATARQLEEQQAQFREALASRDVIGQAKGLLMERYGLEQDAAFALLVRYSRSDNVALREVAQELLRTRRLPDRHDGPPG